MNCVNKFIPTRTYKEYYDDNKIRIAEQQKQYKKDHKELISLQKNQKHMCYCGGKYTSTHKSHHMKSQRYLKYQENQKQPDEIKIEPQIIEEQDEIILKQPQISEKEHLSEEKQIHAKMMKENKSKQLNELHECACGATYSARNKARHMKSKSHAKCLEVEKCAI
jgi:hypothetical protein